MRSLRREALLWLSGLLGVLGVASAASSYYLVQDETNSFLDSQLRQIAYYVDDTPSVPVRPTPDDPLYEPEDDFLVQIWDVAGRSILASDPGVPIVRRTTTGFSNETTPSETWRTFTYVTPQRTVQISQRLSVREELARDSALRSALPVVVLIPLSWLLLGFVIDRVMRRLDRLAAVVGAREADSREPIPLRDVPREVVPLVRAMNDLLDRLGRALERQRRFVSDAAHELRTPLAALQLQIGNVRGVAKGRDLLSRLADLEAGARRASNLVAQLLRLARYDADHRPAPADVLDLTALVEDCVREIAPVAAAAGLAVAIKAGTALRLRGVASELRILIANLLDNAVRYTPRGGTIEIEAGIGADGNGLVEIRDSGPGIPEQLRDRVFERFFRASAPTIEGSGLGLAIARSIAEHHGIAIVLENRACGIGLTARLSVPASALVHG